MQIKAITIVPSVSVITVFMNPIEYAAFTSSFAHPGVKAIPTEDGYLVTTEKGGPLDGYLQRNAAEQYQDQYEQGIREMIVSTLQAPAPAKV